MGYEVMSNERYVFLEISSHAQSPSFSLPVRMEKVSSAQQSLPYSPQPFPIPLSLFHNAIKSDKYNHKHLPL
jgi:hypothetical protein